MSEYNPNFPTDEGRRTYALDKALQSADAGVDADGVVEAAKVFEGYLKNGAPAIKEIGVQMLPPPAKVVSDRFTLEKPKHTNVTYGPCLACEWDTLKRKINDAQA